MRFIAIAIIGIGLIVGVMSLPVLAVPSPPAGVAGNNVENLAQQPSAKELRRIRQLTKQAQRVSLELSRLVIGNLGSNIDLPEMPSVQYTFITPEDGGETQGVVLIDGLVDGKLTTVGCQVDPPGVSCPAPCPPC